MTNKYLVACDGSPASDRALEFAIKQAKIDGAPILLAYIVEWSPYSFMTPQELEERHKHRSHEIKRVQTAVIDPLIESVENQGIKAYSIIRYGKVAKVLADIAKKEEATQLFIGRTGQSSFSARVLGSVAGTMVQISTVPCTIVP
ncbi:universal stress protein [Psychromonas sp. PT13]|uniref:universal stress protein n=1 Tax=Psychromonas sp. PT13 TaxID=3439547 RepID=UPI003EB9DF6A